MIRTATVLGAFTTASLAAEPQYMAAEGFFTRKDGTLDDAEIRKLLVGNTLADVTYTDQQFLLEPGRAANLAYEPSRLRPAPCHLTRHRAALIPGGQKTP